MLITADVQPGDGRGRQIGFPTLNLEYSPAYPDGVYAGWCRTDATGPWLPAACHIGSRPTFNRSKTLEVHVINQQLSETPASLTVFLGQQLRGVVKFSGSEELAAQIKADILQAQSYCENHDPPA